MERVRRRLFRIPTETIGTRFGGIPHGLPAPQIPAVTFDSLRDLVQPATTIALLAAIESLLSAVVAVGMILAAVLFIRRTALKRARREPKIVVLRMREALFMDATGLNALEDLHEKLKHRRPHLLLVGPHAQPLMVMERAGLIEAVGRDNLCADIDHALGRAKAILSEGEPGRS